MTPPHKNSAMRRYYERRFGKDHTYYFWAATRELTTVSDQYKVNKYVVFRWGDWWCWGMDTDIETMNAWRWEHRFLMRAPSKRQQLREAQAKNKVPPKKYATTPEGQVWKTSPGNKFIQEKTINTMYQVADMVDAGMATGDIARAIGKEYINTYYYVQKYKKNPELFVDRHRHLQ